ncbi:hypothetical protein SCHPADRAFT_898351 [Schizopora paradoxa]|uniref:Transmembrane protein n=1 Tax=Schizopora paradoxa TaxID=27342 RepID=A0A0H2SRP6_9AGAM|nr:hypothetical protein SCHPADRAFT_898351 [Schizopora paradoxa]
MPRSKSAQSRVEYEKLRSDFAPTQGLFGARFNMLLCFIIGTALAVVHHLFYSYLNDKPIFTGSGNNLRKQSIANAIGNALAYVVKASFAFSIAVAFVQQFWARLRRHKGGVPIKEIDVIADCKEGIATLSAFKAWYYAFWLFAMSAMASSMALISIIVPGALKVASASFYASSSCSVNTVNLPNGSDLDTFFMQWFERRVIAQGTFMPPSLSCVGACRYNVSFEAAALNCTDITSTYDFTPFITPPIPIAVSPGLQLSPPKYLYNATLADNGTAIQVATLNTTDFTTSAVECLPFRASYMVAITHSNVSTSDINVLSTNLIAPAGDERSVFQLASGAFSLLEGALFSNMYEGSLGVGDLSKNEDGTLPSAVMGSPLMILQENLWRWTMDMQTALPWIMQNISLSLLSEDVAAASKVSIVTPVTSTCLTDSTFYVYDSSRLLITYGVAFAATAMCVIVGLWGIHLNGGFEESLSFTRLLSALVNPEIVNARGRIELTLNTRLRLQTNDGQEGSLVPL